MTYRVYYNRGEDAPQVWSVDEGSTATEINVQSVDLHGLYATTKYNSAAEYPEPTAWFEIENARMEIHKGTAHLWRKE